MRILAVQFKNLNSLVGEWCIDFTADDYATDGIFAIVGPTGAGKSTLLDALCLALYGCTPRLGKISKGSNDIMSRTQGECYAEVTFATQKGVFRCHWSQHRAQRKAGRTLQNPKHEIIEHDTGKVIANKIADVLTHVEACTGMDFERFTRSMLLAQGSFDAFLKADANERAPMLEQITGTGIYSDISMKVHEHKQQAHKHLQLLEAESSGISLLSADEEASLYESIATLETQSNQQRQQVDLLKNLCQAYDVRDDITVQLNNVLERIETNAREYEAFAPELQRLTVAKTAASLQPQYVELTQQRDTQTRIATQLQECHLALPDISTHLVQAQSALADAQHDEHTCQTDWDKAQPCIQQIRQLDVMLTEKQLPVQRLESEYRDKQENHEALVCQQAQYQSELTQSSALLAQCEAQLSGRSVDETLVATLPVITRNLKLWRQTYEEGVVAISALQHSNEQVAHYDALQAQQTAQSQAATQRYEQSKAALTALETAYAQLLGDTPLSQQRETLKSLQERSGWVRQCQEHCAMMTQVEQQLSGLDHNIGELKSSLSGITASVQQLQQQQYEAEQCVQALIALQQSQRLVAHYEEARLALKADEECPLCGSKKHPFNEQAATSKDVVDESEQRLSSAQQRLSDYTSALQDARTHKTTLERDLVHAQQREEILAGELRESYSQLQDLFASVETFDDLAGLLELPKLPELLSQGRVDSIALKVLTESLDTLQHQIVNHCQDGQARLDKLEQDKDALQQWEQRCNTEYQQVLTIQNTLDVNHQKLAQHLADRERGQVRVNDLQNKVVTMAEELTVAIEPVMGFKTMDSLAETVALEGVSANAPKNDAPADAPDIDRVERLSKSAFTQAAVPALETLTQAIIDYLQRRLNQWQSLIEQQKQYQTDTNTAADHLSRIQERLDMCVTERDACQEQLKAAAAARDAIQQERKALSDEEPEQWERRLKLAMDKASLRCQESQQVVQRVLNEQLKLNEKKAHFEQEQVRVDQALKSAEQHFNGLLREHGFGSEHEYTESLLSHDIRARLDAQRQALERQKTVCDTQHAELIGRQQQNNAALNDLNSGLNRASEHTGNLNTLGDLNDGEHRERLYQDSREGLQALQQQLGACRQTLAEDQNRRDQLTSKRVAIDNAQMACDRIDALHALIGSSDGNKYRNFAQGLTFDLVIAHANSKLQVMSDRYLLVRDTAKPLELAILDSYQAGEKRSTKNLSGGESFLVSLALALGLSQMSSQRVRVDSLFLDEGFGTLDDDALDIALDTLGSLQQEGTLIGVISHIASVKERIPTQIRVQPLSGGLSELAGPGVASKLS